MSILGLRRRDKPQLNEKPRRAKPGEQEWATVELNFTKYHRRQDDLTWR